MGLQLNSILTQGAAAKAALRVGLSAVRRWRSAVAASEEAAPAWGRVPVHEGNSREAGDICSARADRCSRANNTVRRRSRTQRERRAGRRRRGSDCCEQQYNRNSQRAWSGERCTLATQRRRGSRRTQWGESPRLADGQAWPTPSAAADGQDDTRGPRCSFLLSAHKRCFYSTAPFSEGLITVFCLAVIGLTTT